MSQMEKLQPMMSLESTWGCACCDGRERNASTSAGSIPDLPAIPAGWRRVVVDRGGGGSPMERFVCARCESRNDDLKRLFAL
jgi:hypothetical protein